MNFQDQALTCEQCDKKFIWTVTAQRQAHNADQELVPPEQCAMCRLRDPETGRFMGHVKWFNLEKGYGFIAKPDGGEVFFHRNQVVDGELAQFVEGALVSFEEQPTDKGSEANEVKLETQSD